MSKCRVVTVAGSSWSTPGLQLQPRHVHPAFNGNPTHLGGLTGCAAERDCTGTYDTRATTAPVSFTLRVDPRNAGVELRRTSDQAQPYQRAAVTVDGAELPGWLQPPGNAERRWLDDTYQIPASATAGKREITVTLTPAEGAPPWSAESYEAHTLRPTG